MKDKEPFVTPMLLLWLLSMTWFALFISAHELDKLGRRVAQLEARVSSK